MRFVLVHGAYHGPWCWDHLLPHLRDRGHSAVTVDLPIGDPAAGAARYADTIATAVGADHDTVVVAHSMSGLALPLAAQQVGGLRLMVFLCAFVPRPGLSANDLRAQEGADPDFTPSVAEFDDLGDDVWMVGPTTATEMFFHDVEPDVANWAVAQLRPQAYRVFSEVTPLQRWPATPSAYVVCRDDHAINPQWGRDVAREHLGIEPIELDGGHSPFLTRPAELADVLHRLVT